MRGTYKPSPSKKTSPVLGPLAPGPGSCRWSASIRNSGTLLGGPVAEHLGLCQLVQPLLGLDRQFRRACGQLLHWPADLLEMLDQPGGSRAGGDQLALLLGHHRRVARQLVGALERQTAAE